MAENKTKITSDEQTEVSQGELYPDILRREQNLILKVKKSQP